VTAAGFELGDRSGRIPNATDPAAPTIPCTKAGCHSTDSYNLTELERFLNGVKGSNPPEDHIIVRAGNSVDPELIDLVLLTVAGREEKTLFSQAELVVVLEQVLRDFIDPVYQTPVPRPQVTHCLPASDANLRMAGEGAAWTVPRSSNPSISRPP